MRTLFIILLLSSTLAAFGQIQPDTATKVTFKVAIPCADTSFTKHEAKNQMTNGLKEGKWVEYLQCYNSDTDCLDTAAKFYRLAIYRSGMPFGVVREYYKSGKIEGVTPYTNDKINGVKKTYYENGQLEEEYTYIDGKHTGIAKWYHENGVLWTEIPFDTTGTINGMRISYWDNGKVNTMTPFTDGQINGVEKKYEKESGLLYLENPYKDGKEDGVQKYYQRGKLKEETIFINGKEGATKYYDENGNEIKK